MKNRVGFLLESCQDPKTYLVNGEGDASASFWAWPETIRFLEKYKDQGMIDIQFDQGLFGHPRKKPTGCMTNLPDMSELHGCRTGSCEGSLADNLDERLYTPNGVMVSMGSRVSKGYSSFAVNVVRMVWNVNSQIVEKFGVGTMETTPSSRTSTI